MDKSILIKQLAGQLQLKEFQVANTIELFEQGATLPFISRYRKEKTGSLDEVQIMDIQTGWKKLMDLESRRASIIASIEEQEKMTPELLAKLEQALTMTELEDLYLPYKSKRKTRAVKAKENGLEPLAKILMSQNEWKPEHAAERFVKGNIQSVEEALAGARDIIAEWVNENIKVRQSLRRLFENEAIIKSVRSSKANEDGHKFQDYFDYSERLKKCPSHRFLAILRGEREDQLKLSIEPDQDQAIQQIERFLIRADNPSADQVKEAIRDSYKRLLAPSLETEIRNSYKEKADLAAIQVFADNLEQLLLMPPLGQKRILGIDPGFRTGCKVVCLDAQGALIHNETIYPHPPQNERKQAARKLSALADTYKIDAIAIGNGTASRETESFVQKYVSFTRKVQVYVVSESGASIYSASSVAREEFPDFDVTVRGAVSIGRRLMDPLAELVKIDPKSIGVGQYQHDVDQKKLHESLDQVVELCVNKVGVHLNTAGKYLLTHISGLGPQLAQNIENHIRENGPFKTRQDLLQVPRMGAKAYELAAGFLRITDSVNPLDNSAVHPESYHLVTKMAHDVGVELADLIGNKAILETIKPDKYVTQDAGLPTIIDILSELEKPGRDPRGIIKVFSFDPNVHSIEDLTPGMILPGIITNITDFGAFVDVGVKQDGLIHLSQMANKYIKHPNEVVKINQQLQVRVLSVDVNRRRIQLSILDLD
jgi:uncharacterized protein